MSSSTKQEDESSSDQLAATTRPSDDDKPVKSRLSLCTKLCYAVGGAPYQLTGVPLGLFLQVFLLDIAELDAFYASIILFTGRVWDAVTDPTIGFLVARSPWTRFGQLLPWVVLSTPLGVISYFLTWYVPPSLVGNTVGLFLWYLLCCCVFQTMQTCLHVPYTSLTMFITSEQAERDSCTAYRMSVEILSVVMATAIQGQIVRHAACIPSSAAAHSSLSVPLAPPLPARSLEETKSGYLIAATIIGTIYILCVTVLFSGVRERKELCHPNKKSFAQAIQMVVRHGPYAKLMCGLVTTSMAYFFLEGNFASFAIYALGFRDDFQNMLLLGMVSAMLTIPFWQWFLTRYGKKTAVYFGITFGMPFILLMALVEGNLTLTYCLSFFAGISLAVVLLLPWSMLPDVVDDFKVANPESTGHEAIFYSFYVFFIKFANGISLGVSTLALDLAGYVVRGCEQPHEVKLTLKFLVSIVPIVLITFGLYIFYSYPIDEKRRRRNRKALQEMRESQANRAAKSEMSSTDTALV